MFGNNLEKETNQCMILKGGDCALSVTDNILSLREFYYLKWFLIVWLSICLPALFPPYLIMKRKKRKSRRLNKATYMSISVFSCQMERESYLSNICVFCDNLKPEAEEKIELFHRATRCDETKGPLGYKANRIANRPFPSHLFVVRQWSPATKMNPDVHG